MTHDVSIMLVSIEHVRSHTGNRGNEAADKLANMGAEIEEGHRIVERGSAEPPPTHEEEHMTMAENCRPI